jgi:hypothetical protein
MMKMDVNVHVPEKKNAEELPLQKDLPHPSLLLPTDKVEIWVDLSLRKGLGTWTLTHDLFDSRVFNFKLCIDGSTSTRIISGRDVPSRRMIKIHLLVPLSFPNTSS